MEEKKRRGRPRLADSVRRRNNITITMRDALRAALEEAAAANQRSVSAEIEHQLEGHELLRTMAPILRRPDLYWVLTMLNFAVEHVERETGKAWDVDEETVEKTLKSAVESMFSLKRNKAVSAKLGWGKDEEQS